MLVRSSLKLSLISSLAFGSAACSAAAGSDTPSIPGAAAAGGSGGAAGAAGTAGFAGTSGSGSGGVGSSGSGATGGSGIAGSGGAATGGAGGTPGCLSDADCAPGTLCDQAAGECVPGGACGGEEFELAFPNLFMAFDRSCSMNHGNPVSKWVEAVAAIEKVTTDFAGKIRWGLALFPDLDGDSCTQNDPQTLVPIGDANESAIVGLLNDPLILPGVAGRCDTNIDSAVAQIDREPAFATAKGPKYGMLLTDGKQNGCNEIDGAADTIKTLQSMTAKGIKTFIVGFKGGVDEVAMNAFAEAGGLPQSGARKYYQADDAGQLDAALASIGSLIVECRYPLQGTPQDANTLFVFLNDQSVPRDAGHTEGWDYDPATNSIEFYGAACDKLKQGQASDIDVVFGCDMPTPH